MKDEKELKFPLTFSVCPACGSTRRAAEMVTEKEIKKGKIKKETKIPFMSGRAPIFDPTQVSRLVGLPLQCPLLVAYFDICYDCGTLYCVRVEKHTGAVEVEMPKGKPPVGFGRG